jgi:membrane-associated phospholipid phosphatase
MQSTSLTDRFALLVSGVFHPLLVPTYMLVILVLVNPFLFGQEDVGLVFITVLINTLILPLVAVGVMRGLEMIDSFHLEDRMERIGPYLVVLVLYLWMYINFTRRGTVPTAYTAFTLGMVIALSITFFINVFSKISAHTVGMGGLVAMVLITMLFFDSQGMKVTLGSLGDFRISLSLLLLFIILIAGLVGSSRLKLKAHVDIEIYGGYLIGFLSQLIALRYYF